MQEKTTKKNGTAPTIREPGAEISRTIRNSGVVVPNLLYCTCGTASLDPISCLLPIRTIDDITERIVRRRPVRVIQYVL